MNPTAIRTLTECREYTRKHGSERASFEKLLAEDNLQSKFWTMPGYCSFCNKAVHFELDWFNFYEHPTMGKTPCFRERLVCPCCRLNNRQRFMANYLLQQIATKESDLLQIYLCEQVTPFFKLLSSRLKGHNVIGSEYLGESYSSGQVIKGIRHEDALALSFDDGSIDIVASNDVYEHVPDIDKAFTEAHRVLKSGGELVFTVPFQLHEADTKRRAEIVDGTLGHLLPERYHCNPVSDKGSLVFYDFGWDMLEMLEHAGFTDACMLSYYSPLHGHLGAPMQSMFLALKG